MSYNTGDFLNMQRNASYKQTGGEEDFYSDYLEGNYQSTYDDNSFYYHGDLDKLKKPWLKETDYIPTVTVYGLTFLVGIIGNILVLVTLLGDFKQRTNTTVFLVSLATSDIIFLVVCVPYEISRHFIDHWYLGTFLCKFSGFIEMMTAVLTVSNLTIVSIERYVAIVHPMRSRYLCTLGNLRRLIPTVWVMAAILSCPAFFIMSTEMSIFYNNQSAVNMIFCTDYGVNNEFRLGFALYQLLIMFLLPTVVMVMCYVKVVHVLWVSTKHLSSMMPRDRVSDALFLTRVETCSFGANSSSVPRLLKRAITSHKSKVLASRKQIIKLLLMIIVAFLLCWGPKLAFRIMQKLQLPFLFSEEAYVIKVMVDCLPYVQSCINPILYCFMSRNFRRSIKVMFARRFKSSLARTGSLDHIGLQTNTSSSEGALKADYPIYLKVIFKASDSPGVCFSAPQVDV